MKLPVRMTRRQALGAGAGALGWGAASSIVRAAPLAGSAGQAAAEERALVVIQLFGGNDGLNTLVPFEDDNYYRARPSLAVSPGSVWPLDDLNGLHPRLGRLARWAREGRIGFLQNVGYPDPNLSHFRSQDVWDAAATAGGTPPTGWLGRLHDANVSGIATADTAVAMLAVGLDYLPLAMIADTYVAPAVTRLGAYRLHSPRLAIPAAASARHLAVLGELAQVASGDPRLEHAGRAFGTMRRSIEELALAAGVRATSADYPSSQLGADLATSARVLASGQRTRVVFVRHGGYDTHTSQVRRHEKLLEELDGALDAFLHDLSERGLLDRTLIVTVSEFGRRLVESGNAGATGTDHGAASMMMVAGGSVQGGVHGGQPRLQRPDAYGNPSYEIDFRQVYATVIENWFGGDARAVLGQSWPTLGFLA